MSEQARQLGNLDEHCSHIPALDTCPLIHVKQVVPLALNPQTWQKGLEQELHPSPKIANPSRHVWQAFMVLGAVHTLQYASKQELQQLLELSHTYSSLHVTQVPERQNWQLTIVQF